MKNPRIGEMLKKYRKLNRMSVRDVCEKLKEYYDLDVAEKTVYGWESNQAHPTADVFLIICDLYRIDSISSAFSEPGKDGQLVLSREEEELVKNYRRYPSFQPAVRQLLHMTPRRSDRN